MAQAEFSIEVTALVEGLDGYDRQLLAGGKIKVSRMIGPFERVVGTSYEFIMAPEHGSVPKLLYIKNLGAVEVHVSVSGPGTAVYKPFPLPAGAPKLIPARIPSSSTSESQFWNLVRARSESSTARLLVLALFS